jgi:hypothetical protein
VLSVKKILAGRGAVNYYLDQSRRGLADYYLLVRGGLVPAAGFEPAAFCSGGRRSIP